MNMQKRDMKAVKKRAVDFYLSDDGLMGGGPGDFRDAFPGHTGTTVKNDNGILWAAEFYYLLDEYKLLDQIDFDRVYKTIVSLQHENTKGLYDRNPGRGKTLEAHDNLGAISALSVLFDLGFARDICDYGDTRGYFFDNTSPDQPKLKSWKQGPEVFFYKLCAYKTPHPVEFAWFVAATIHTCIFHMHDGATSDGLLTWLKFKALRKVFNRMPKNLVTAIMQIGVLLCELTWKGRLMLYTGGDGVGHLFKIYFRDDVTHPNRILSNGLKF